MNLFFLAFGQLIALAGATQITKAGRENGYSYGKVLAIGLAISATLAGFQAFRMASGVYCVEREYTGFGSRCLQYEEIAPEDRRGPGEAFWGLMMSTVPIGLLSLVLRVRYERKEWPDLERRRREQQEMEDDYRRYMEGWPEGERNAWQQLQSLRCGYLGGAELIILAAAAIEQARGWISTRLDLPDKRAEAADPAQLRKWAAECKNKAWLNDGDVKLNHAAKAKKTYLRFGGVVLTLKVEEQQYKAELEAVEKYFDALEK